MWSLLVYQNAYIHTTALSWHIFYGVCDGDHSCQLRIYPQIPQWNIFLGERLGGPHHLYILWDLWIWWIQTDTQSHHQHDSWQWECPSSQSHSCKTHTMSSLGRPGSNFTETWLNGPTMYWKNKKLQLIMQFCHTQIHPMTAHIRVQEASQEFDTGVCIWNTLVPSPCGFNFPLPLSPESAYKHVTLLKLYDPGSKAQNILKLAAQKPFNVEPKTKYFVSSSSPESQQDRPRIVIDDSVLSTPETSWVWIGSYEPSWGNWLGKGLYFEYASIHPMWVWY